MRGLIGFIFGVMVGAGGTLLWLRKDIKKELAMIKNDSEALPFVMDEEKDKKEEKEDDEKPIIAKKDVKVSYDKVINDVQNGVTPPIDIPIRPSKNDDLDGKFVEDTNGNEIIEIDKDEFNNDKVHGHEQLIYFRGDSVLSTESGTIIKNPAMLIGDNWEAYVGHYAKNTAFVRNSRIGIDYEIYVENGLYTDEYGIESTFRED